MTFKPAYIPWIGCAVLTLIILIGGSRMTRQKEREIEARVRAEMRADSLLNAGVEHANEAAHYYELFLDQREAYKRALSGRPTTSQHHAASQRTLSGASLAALDSLLFSPVKD